MDEKKYRKTIQTSVTNFLFCGDDYLFLHRSKDKKVDPDRLNGVGGKVEPGENYLQAAMRETEEETGYKISRPEDIQLCAVIRLEGGYEEDWVMCFFKTKVENKKIPVGHKTKDGELLWLHKDKILNSGRKVVDDLNYCMKEIIAGDSLSFITLQLNSRLRVIAASTSTLPVRTMV